MDARHPVLRPWIHSAEVRGKGGVSLRELEHNNYDMSINEVVQPWKWTLLCSVWCSSNKMWTHITPFFICSA